MNDIFMHDPELQLVLDFAIQVTEYLTAIDISDKKIFFYLISPENNINIISIIL